MGARVGSKKARKSSRGISLRGGPTTRPAAEQRREPLPAQRRIKRKLDAVPDRVDIRDWFYAPRLAPLPDQLINCASVPEILDQGAEGSCTGFALAAVINYLLASRSLVHLRDRGRLVSPQMLYDMARRYDEWPGENYDGSSARGAMKGWVAHGVCSLLSWPSSRKGAENFTPQVASESLLTPGGAYFRVMHREIRDMHAALNEVGILYMTLMVHEGWDNPGPDSVELTYTDRSGNLRMQTVPIIRRSGKADGGHAVAIVGYTKDGFIIQNSWGKEWGVDGFALLPYEDYLLHATDVWVAQLGVPISIDLWGQQNAADTTAGRQRAAAAIPLNDIRPYVINIGNDGKLSDSGHYWTTEADLDRLFDETIPAATEKWARKRILFYLHGGLNDEDSVARRIVAFRDVCLANEIYPVHLMWETGAWETLKSIIEDSLGAERAGGVREWIEKLRDGLVEAKDRSLELTLAKPGTALWSEMKENARLASATTGGMPAVVKAAQRALKKLNQAERNRWEIHVVAHSAGSIFLAHAIDHLLSVAPLKTVQLLAPAITVDLFKQTMLPLITKGSCPQPSLYLLTDTGERDDDVGPYGKSLLYLVSNAFEASHGVPLLGMEHFVKGDAANGMATLFARKSDGLPSLVRAGAAAAGQKGEDTGNVSRSDSHGGFDNDPDTLNSVLYRICRGKPARPFQLRDLQY